MLLEFKASNYKSFKDEFVFSMIPAPKQKGLDYSVLEETVKKSKYKALCSGVIYGSNGSGKSNIIGAMETLKSIILRGNIRNFDAFSSNAAMNTLQLIPNNTLAEPLPVSFSISFIDKGFLFDYSFTMDIGSFLDKNYKRKILKETLFINNNLYFDRDSNAESFLSVGLLGLLYDDLKKFHDTHKDSAVQNALLTLDEEELFLMNGYKNIFSPKISGMITEWLNEKFIVVYQADSYSIEECMSEFIEDNSHNTLMNDALKLFGLNSNKVDIKIDPKNARTIISSLVATNKEGGHREIDAELYESYGTLRFVKMFPLVYRALKKGQTLVVDEFDASLHPMVLLNLINLFHNDEINKNQGQLIFNTHNPIFLNSNVFRRDEIKFVERIEDEDCSNLYSLSDFGTEGKSGVRKNDDYMKNYLKNRYGSIQNVDFSTIFETLINEDNEVKDE